MVVKRSTKKAETKKKTKEMCERDQSNDKTASSIYYLFKGKKNLPKIKNQ